MIPVLLRDDEEYEGDGKEASQLEQSILPEDEAIIKEMIGELEKQVICSVDVSHIVPVMLWVELTSLLRADRCRR